MQADIAEERIAPIVLPEVAGYAGVARTLVEFVKPREVKLLVVGSRGLGALAL